MRPPSGSGRSFPPAVISRAPVGLHAGNAQCSRLPRFTFCQASTWQAPGSTQRASSVIIGRAARAGAAIASPTATPTNGLQCLHSERIVIINRSVPYLDDRQVARYSVDPGSDELGADAGRLSLRQGRLQAANSPTSG